MASPKLEEYRATSAHDIMVADWQRISQAGRLAECELGPMPVQRMNETKIDFLVRRDKYLIAHNELSRLIVSRPN
jgi:hypothetical protein